MIGMVLHTIISRLLLLIIALTLFPFFLIIACMPEKWRMRNRFIYKVVHFFYWIVLKCTFVPIKIEGKENIPTQPAIFAANHQSSLDIPLAGVLAQSDPHLWLARSELMDSIILRFLLPRFAVVVDVNEPHRAMRALVRVIQLVRDTNQHIMIFPEGQRHHDDNVHDFFPGFVILAKKTGRAVVPVRIFYANRVYPVGTFWVRWHPIVIRIGKPMVMREDEKDEEFKNRVHQWFIQQSKD